MGARVMAMFKKILIANRGEIACRIARTANQMGITTVAVYSEMDRYSLHVQACDEAYCVGPAPASESYLNAARILEVAQHSGAQAIHPGYGFLSENAVFARACEEAGIVFIGPPATAIEAMGSKSEAKRLMQSAGVPLVPGYHGDDQSESHLISESTRMGFPQLIKASAGGGGKGMRVVNQASEFVAALTSARREALSSFGDDKVLIERYLIAPRHVEIQIFADQQGNVVHLFERDCSIQRRHQKVLEEAPAPGMSLVLRAKMGEAAINCAKAINYVGAGTIEFLLDQDGSFYFMEMNTRLQVEHPVTEMITGLDLVQWQLVVASGDALPLSQTQIKLNGHAFEVRIYAESPDNNFLPSTGKIEYLEVPDQGPQVRVDTGIKQGDEIGVYYDPMISKLIVHATDRKTALEKMRQALKNYRILGLQTNIGFLDSILAIDDFASGEFDTGFIEKNQQRLFESVPEPLPNPVLLAGLYLLLSRQAGLEEQRITSFDRGSPWHLSNGWRMNQVPNQALLLNDGITDYRIEVSQQGVFWRFSVSSLEDSFDCHLSGKILENNCLLAEIESRRYKVPVVETGGKLMLWFNNRQWIFGRHNMAGLSLAEDTPDGDLLAPMPGNVIELSVSVGDTVLKGDVLVVVEAMKMEHSIVAPEDATVKEIHFQVGDQVNEGDHLIALE
jgi:3-methylcrotonyl-CoA carboxylase alpha subunit